MVGVVEGGWPFFSSSSGFPGSLPLGRPPISSHPILDKWVWGRGESSRGEGRFPVVFKF